MEVSKEFDAEGVFLAKDLRLAAFNEDGEGLEQDIGVHAVQLLGVERHVSYPKDAGGGG